MNEKLPLRLKFKDTVSTDGKAAVHVAHVPKPMAHKTKPRPPTVGTENLVVKCGHTIVFDLFAKDAFREQRRTKAVTRDCPACRQARVQADMVAAKERRVKKTKTFAQSLKPRLSDGARFVATYDAAQVQWTGSLTIEGAVFEKSASSLNKLLHKLDDIYRAAKTEPVVVPDPAVVIP